MGGQVDSFAAVSYACGFGSGSCLAFLACPSLGEVGLA